MLKLTLVSHQSIRTGTTKAVEATPTQTVALRRWETHRHNTMDGHGIHRRIAQHSQSVSELQERSDACPRPRCTPLRLGDAVPRPSFNQHSWAAPSSFI